MTEGKNMPNIPASMTPTAMYRVQIRMILESITGSFEDDNGMKTFGAVGFGC
jgi:hypothetical protein